MRPGWASSRQLRWSEKFQIILYYCHSPPNSDRLNCVSNSFHSTKILVTAFRRNHNFLCHTAIPVPLRAFPCGTGIPACVLPKSQSQKSSPLPLNKLPHLPTSKFGPPPHNRNRRKNCPHNVA